MITLLGFSTSNVFLGRLLRFLTVSSLALYAADVYVMQAFFTRLYVTWIFTIGATPGIVFDHLFSTGLFSFLSLIFFLSLIIFSVIHVPSPQPIRFIGLIFLLSLVSISAIAARSNNVHYVNAWAVQNVFFANQFSGISSRYTDEYLESANEQEGALSQCQNGQNQQRDLIVLILESWSPYQSALWGGMNDWTPELDKIAQSSLRATRFIAGGFNTNQGLMSIIAGIPILSPMTSQFTRKTFEPAWGWEQTLPKQLAKGGYHTALLTTGDLSFMDKGKWFHHVGFQHIEGHDHPFYDDKPRGYFKSAPDEALFDRALEFWSTKDSANSPLGLVVESVSTHSPFIHPITKEKTEEAAIRYMDMSVGRFYQKLHAKGFFDAGGILVIVSDHRSMTVVGEEEFETYGALAPALVPMLIYSKSIDPVTVNRLYHQSDLTPSLATLLTNEGCGYPEWKSLFADYNSVNHRCVYHASGKNWSQIMVYCESGQGIIELNGDESEFVDGYGISPAERERILHQIAYFRNAAQTTTDKYLSRASND